MYKKIEKSRLYENVSQQIEESILSGQLGVGTVLPSEKELMETFGVSRITIREALLSLQQRGLVEMRNGERALVSSPDVSRLLNSLHSAVQIYLRDDEGVKNFQQIRVFVEMSSVHLVAKNATDDQIVIIEKALEANRAAIGDVSEFGRTDVIFHQTIVEMVGNKLLSGIQHSLHEWLRQQRTTALKSPGMLQSAFEAHLAIFERIRNRDPIGAAAEMERHLTEVEKRYWVSTS